MSSATQKMSSHILAASNSTQPAKLNRKIQVVKWLSEQFNIPFVCYKQGYKIKVIHPFDRQTPQRSLTSPNIGGPIGLREYELSFYFSKGFYAIKPIHWAQLELLIQHDCYPGMDNFTCKCGGTELIKHAHKSVHRMNILECESCGLEFFWKVSEK